MFQNISSEDIEHKDFEKGTSNKRIIREIFKLKNILLYIMSFLVSMVGFGDLGSPFALAIFAATCSNSIPSGIVFILAGSGVLLKYGKAGLLMYILTALVFTIGAIALKPEVKDADRNEKRKLGGYIFLSTILVQVVSLFFGQLYLYNILIAFALSILTYIFYKIFSNAIVVIRDYREKAAFSIEEIMAAAIIITIAISVFGDLPIYGFSITNIICILMVLILGWKNGVLVGVTAGTTIGMILGIVRGGEPLLIAAYAISGLMAGILNRLGKIGAIIGFGVGNLLFAYVVNGNVAEIIYLKEIIVASLGLLLVPKSIDINIIDIIGDTKLLPSSKNRMIENTENTVFKLNNMSETITELADTYKEVAVTAVEEDVSIEKLNRNIFVDTVFSNIELLSDNLLYEDITNLETGILNEIFDILCDNGEVDFTDIIKVFEKRNSYILATDDKEVKRNVEKDIWRMIRLINSSYMLGKSNFVWMQKTKENQKNISSQLEGISEVINSVAEELSEKEDKKTSGKKNELEIVLNQKEIKYKDLRLKIKNNKKYIINMFMKKFDDITEELIRIKKIEEIFSKALGEEIVLQKQKDMEDGSSLHIYSSKDKYNLQLGIAKTTKNRSSVSGDSSIQIKLDDGKYLLAISDGMGSGPNAKRNSQIAVKILKRLLMSGFETDSSIKLINSTLSLNTNQEMYATLDIGILDLYTGNMEMIKNGAMPTYIKSNGKVQKVDSSSLPTGILDNIDLVVHDIDLKKDDYLIMCTDGIVESKEGEPEWLEEFINNINTDNVQRIADLILTEAIDNNYGLPKDDMTIIVGKITL